MLTTKSLTLKAVPYLEPWAPIGGTALGKRETEIGKMNKKLSLWSYKLIYDLQQHEEDNPEKSPGNPCISSRKAKHVIYINKDQNIHTDTNTDSVQVEEITLIRYSQQWDFRRNLIKGSTRAQRRKTLILEMFQANVHTPTI